MFSPPTNRRSEKARALEVAAHAMSKTVASSEPAAPPAPPPPAAYGAASMVDLESVVNWSQCELLNGTPSSRIDSFLKQGLRDQELILAESDADEQVRRPPRAASRHPPPPRARLGRTHPSPRAQLLVRIAFNGKVKLHSFQIDAPADGRAPRLVKFFANRIGLDFGDAEDTDAEQAEELEPEQLGAKLPLKFVKFQNVDTLTVFVGSNQSGGDVTALSGLRLWGTSNAGMSMGDFKRVAGEKGEGE